MALGAIELALLLVVGLGTVAAMLATRNRYLIGVPALFIVAAVCSPPDPISTVLFAVPSSLIYLAAVTRLQRRTA